MLPSNPPLICTLKCAILTVLASIKRNRKVSYTKTSKKWYRLEKCRITPLCDGLTKLPNQLIHSTAHTQSFLQKGFTMKSKWKGNVLDDLCVPLTTRGTAASIYNPILNYTLQQRPLEMSLLLLQSSDTAETRCIVMQIYSTKGNKLQETRTFLLAAAVDFKRVTVTLNIIYI